MPYNYSLKNYRLHSISKLTTAEDGSFTCKTVDLMKGLAIEKQSSSSSNSYFVVAFLKPNEDCEKYLNVEFVANRITDIATPQEFETFMRLYFMAHKVIYGDGSVYGDISKDGLPAPAKDGLPAPKEKETEAQADGDGQPLPDIIHTKCLICGEDITESSHDVNMDKFISPYIKVCEHCKKAVQKARAEMEWEEEVETW